MLQKYAYDVEDDDDDNDDDDNDLLPSEIVQNVVVDDVVLYGLKRHKIIWYFSMVLS